VAELVDALDSDSSRGNSVDVQVISSAFSMRCFMKILVTGAAGFIGFHLCHRLHQRGNVVVGYDNFNDYYSVQLKKNRTAQIPDIEVVEGDLCDFKKLDSLFQEHKFTHVAHLAAQAGVRYSVTNPMAYIKSNLEGFTNILEMCRKYKTTLVYASSSSVYGLNDKIPFSEKDKTDKPASLYGATKKANELMAFSYHHLYEIPVTGLRFFTVYGPWGRPDMAHFKFTKSIYEGSPIEVYNEGNMYRDFTYIDDIIDGTVAALDLGAGCEVFNLGNHKKEKLSYFIEVIEKALGKKSVKNYMPIQLGDVLTTYADVDYSKEKLGYSPKTSIEEGMQQFINWFLKYTS
jgi:UDP-glucuronate 4-epimerase